jgi:hypothetical protein
MMRLTRPAILVGSLVALALASTAAHGQALVGENPKKMVLVELFTSQG